MYLLVCATELEASPIRQLLMQYNECELLVAGVGLVETTLSLTKYLTASYGRKITAVINFGVAGGFPDKQLEVLDLCLATKEVLGDFGICFGDRMAAFDDPGLAEHVSFDLAGPVYQSAGQILSASNMPYFSGTFVTVQGVSGSRKRGKMLGETYDALCENMEGAAVARVCRDFSTPCLELRCLSNLVVDRDRSAWQLSRAAGKCAETAAHIVGELISRRSGQDL